MCMEVKVLTKTRQFVYLYIILSLSKIKKWILLSFSSASVLYFYLIVMFKFNWQTNYLVNGIDNTMVSFGNNKQTFQIIHITNSMLLMSISIRIHIFTFSILLFYLLNVLTFNDSEIAFNTISITLSDVLH